MYLVYTYVFLTINCQVTRSYRIIWIYCIIILTKISSYQYHFNPLLIYQIPVLIFEKSINYRVQTDSMTEHQFSTYFFNSPCQFLFIFEPQMQNFAESPKNDSLCALYKTRNIFSLVVSHIHVTLYSILYFCKILVKSNIKIFILWYG